MLKRGTDKAINFTYLETQMRVLHKKSRILTLNRENLKYIKLYITFYVNENICKI